MPPAKKQEIVLKRPDIKKFEFVVESLNPIILHRFSEKAKWEMLESMTTKKSRKEVRDVKDHVQEFENSMYRLPDGRPAFPADGFKEAAIRGVKVMGGVMTDARGSFFVVGEYSPADGRDLVPLIPVNCEVESREDVVRLSNGSSDLRYRGMIQNWKAVIKIEYNAATTSPDLILGYFEAGGFGTGVGEWRPERSGTFGRFRVATSGEGQA